jgi:D-sedoheptulose 7-phosphate isomerase
MGVFANDHFAMIAIGLVYWSCIPARKSDSDRKRAIMSDSSNPTAMIFDRAIAEHLEVIRRVQNQQPVLESIARAMSGALRFGGKILWCGNGGSAADSQHLAAEIVGRFRRERRGLPSIALTTDTSILTAVANDYGYEAVFSRQVEALGNAGDLLVGISTSGNSQNVVQALIAARAQGLVTVAFTGAGGGKLGTLADYLFAVESRDTARIQEAQILAGHMLCDWIELDSIQGQAKDHNPSTTNRVGVSE